MKVDREYVTVKREVLDTVTFEFTQKELFSFMVQALAAKYPELGEMKLKDATVVELWTAHDLRDKVAATFHFKREA